MKLYTRFSIAAVAIVGVAVIAAGCGGGKSGSDALALVPESAPFYATVNLDLDGKGWKQLEKFSGAFSEKGVNFEKEFTKSASDDVDFAKDVKPWLGDQAGAAVVSLKTDRKAKAKKDKYQASAFIWIEVKDSAKMEKFIKKDGFKKGESAGDFTLWNKKKDTIAVSDSLIISPDDETDVKKIVSFDGKSIKDSKDIKSMTKELSDDALATLVVNGEGIRDLVKHDDDFVVLSNSDMLKEFDGAAVSLSAESKGIRVHTIAEGMKEDSDHGSSKLLRSLPDTTVLALGGYDFGSSLQSGLDLISSTDKESQTAIGQFSALLGVDIKEFTAALDKNYQIALVGDDTGLQALVGTVAGAVFGGGMKSLNPSTLSKAGTAVLAFENGSKTAETLDKSFSTIGGVLGAGSAPKVGKAGEFSTKQVSFMGIPVTSATSKDITAVSVGGDIFTKWGTKTLDDNSNFTDAWSAAKAPKRDILGSVWVDVPRLMKLAEIKSKDGVEAGGLVGWGEADDETYTSDLFLHIKTN